MLESNRPKPDYVINFWISFFLLSLMFILALVVQLVVNNPMISAILWVIFVICFILFIFCSIGYYKKVDMCCRSNNGNGSADTSLYGAGV